MKIGFCFLAYGDEYVREFLQIAPNFPKEDIIVTSDRQIEDYTTIIVNEDFNFHLRVKAIEKALETYDNVLSLDTDHYIRGLDLNSFSKFYNKGVVTKWFGDEVQYLGENITSDALSNGLTSRKDVNEFGRMLYFLNNSEQVKFLDESVLFISITNKESKFKFVDIYKKLINHTENKQPYRETDKTYGALEGCLMYVCFKLSNLELHTESKFLNKIFHHYGPTEGHNVKLKSKLL
jgi:hypothetical protein